MQVVGHPARELQANPAARAPYGRWLDVLHDAAWRSFADVRKARSDVDRVGSCYVFNIGGNKYRLITKIAYEGDDERGRVTIVALLTHAEYDKQRWKKDCKP
jgi:mRNA interferase HigB